MLGAPLLARGLAGQGCCRCVPLYVSSTYVAMGRFLAGAVMYPALVHLVSTRDGSGQVCRLPPLDPGAQAAP